jgi:acetyltransferase-like isoleucine patch superfamily enzyme
VEGSAARVFIASDARLAEVTISVSGANASLFIGSHCRLRRVLLRVAGSDALLAIGRDTTWQSGSCLCLAGQQIVVGDDCMMSYNVIVRTYDAHAIFDRRTRARVNAPAPVVLESHVWLGQRSTVNKGTRIGAGSIVGSDSVASGSLDGSCVYAGVPARRIRRNVAWSRTKKWDDVPADLR